MQLKNINVNDSLKENAKSSKTWKKQTNKKTPTSNQFQSNENYISITFLGASQYV